MISTGMMINKNSNDNYLNLSQIEEIDIKNISANTKAVLQEKNGDRKYFENYNLLKLRTNLLNHYQQLILLME